jgi:AcrR family transcriptional regulator
MASLRQKPHIREERHSRILASALEVFSKSSLAEATTEEIARRARVSKRDLYAAFPDKHSILAAVVNKVLQTGEQNLQRVTADSRQALAPLRGRLEIVGLALVGEILSPVTGFVSRLVFSANIEQPEVGIAYFENWYNRRNQMIAQILLQHLSKTEGRARRSAGAKSASMHFVALITQLPHLTVSLGMARMWTPKSVHTHVKSAVACFLKAYPDGG